MYQRPDVYIWQIIHSPQSWYFLIKMSITHFILTVFTKPYYLNRVGVLAFSFYDLSDEVFWYSLALNNVYKRHVHTFVSMFEYVINILYKPESLSSCVE